MEFVKVYDAETKTVSTIPASELAPGMVRVQVSGSDEILWMDGSQLKQSEYRHPPFSGVRREKVLFIADSLKDVSPMTYESWEDGFRRDLHCDQEIDIWLKLCRLFNDFVERHQLNLEEKQEAFSVLSACLSKTPDTVFELVSAKLLDRATAQELVDAFFSSPA